MDTGGDSGGAERAQENLWVLTPYSCPPAWAVAHCPEDYRLCLERELRRGRAGVCGDPSLRAVLWHILVEDFDLRGAAG